MSESAERLEGVQQAAQEMLALVEAARERLGHQGAMFRTLAVDFDGVIHGYRLGWHDGSIYDAPMEGAEAGLANLMRNNNVFILSTRSPEQIVEWMRAQMPAIPVELVSDGVKVWEKRGVVGVTDRKLIAHAIVDDRAVRFVSWRDTTNLLG